MSSNFLSKFKNKDFKTTFITIFKYTFILGIIFSIIGVGIFSGIFFAYIDTTSEISHEQLQLQDSKTVLYDINNKKYEEIYGSENREWVSINKIPAHLKQAFIAIEDERFYEHNGIDLRRICSAIIAAINPNEPIHGASTITQQLVKNLTGEKQFSIKRKVQEQWRAIQLEKELSKEQILELYLNVVPLGNGITGVQAAAKTYFDKDVSKLTIAESASIAAITNLPAYYNPLKHPDHNKERKELVLSQMKQLEYISKKEYNTSVNKQLAFKKSAIEKISNHSYFTDQVINDVINDLQNKKGYSKAIAEKMIYGGGLKIHTTVNSKIQNDIEEFYNNTKNFVHTNSKSQPESAMVILDPSNGQIRGLIGGIGEKHGQRTFNRATQAFRQPGSSIKPISVYGPAIEEGKITPNTIVSDTPIEIDGWKPHNYDHTFMGKITARTALKKSRNIPAVRILQKVGINDSYAFLERLGISSLKPADKDFAPLALGGLSKGVSTLQMAAAYAPFCNNGIYIKPYSYTRVVDSEGKILLNNSSVESRTVMTERTSYIITNMLKDVITSGTGTLARLNNMPAAGKTGTSSKMIDKWFVGYTPHYVGAVWYGYDHQKPLPRSTWSSALLIWKSVMEKVHSDLSYKEFNVPKGIMTEVAVCTASGKRATSLCHKDINGSKVKKQTFVKGTQPTKYCDIHKPVRICKVSGKLATPYCPTSQTEKKSIAFTGEIPLKRCSIHPPKEENKEKDEEQNNNKTKDTTNSNESSNEDSDQNSTNGNIGNILEE